jgi:serine protease Do
MRRTLRPFGYFLVFAACGLLLGYFAERWLPGTAREASGETRLAGATNFKELEAQVRDGSQTLHGISDNLAKVARLVTPSIVHIQAERRTRRGSIEETGSGVIIAGPSTAVGDGAGFFVVTNRHVVDGTELERIDISLADGRQVKPARLWSDRESDLAVLKLPISDVQPARWGDSSRIEIGNLVLAVGSPFGLSQSITLGIISAKGRRALDLGSGAELLNQDFLQTDAAINPGNSGGPLINLYGEIVGINTAIASNSGGNEGIGFSIPSSIARHVVEQLLLKGKVTRAYLGVKLDPAFKLDTAKRLQLDRLRGARIIEVYPGTPAANASLQVDDVVLECNGVAVQDENHLINMISLLPVNRETELVLFRKGKRMAVKIVVGDRTELEKRSEAPAFQPGNGVYFEELGLTLHRLDAEVAASLGYPVRSTGMLVLTVDVNGPLAGQVEPFDLIEELDRTPVLSVADVRERLRDAPGSEISVRWKRVVRGALQNYHTTIPRSTPRLDP